jgi:hypothetical protein
MARWWPLLIPVPALTWWLLGFPPGWGWILTPVFPTMPITSIGMLVVMLALLVGLGLAVKVALENV